MIESDDEEVSNNEMEEFLDEWEIEFIQNIEDKDKEELEEEGRVIQDYFDTLVGQLNIADKLLAIIEKTTKDETHDMLNKEEYSGTIKKLRDITLKYGMVTEQINKDVMLLYKFTRRINYFWQDCSIEVYTSNFELYQLAIKSAHKSVKKKFIICYA
ncbi:MAG: hypothetical protein HRT71_03935 [Flavobacteriales bacterium]|nr:hypothetical protein [Flavobacteriales bacterium]